MAASLRDFDVLTFDCYGTLIDWETGIWDALQPLIAQNHPLAISRVQGLKAFAAAESEQESETPEMPYPDLLSQVHRRIANELALTSSRALDSDFGASVPYWPAFSDSAEVLRSLKKHYKLVILSNVDIAGFAASNRKLGVEFDAIYTAQTIGSYKPDQRNFNYMLERLDKDHGIPCHKVLHTAQSLHHDHVPAKALGLANAWIDRQRLSASGDWGATAKVAQHPSMDFIFFSLEEMLTAVRASD